MPKQSGPISQRQKLLGSIAFLIIAIILLNNYISRTEKEDPKISVTQVKEIKKQPEVVNVNHYDEQIAKFTISAIMHQSTEIMNTKEQKGIIIVDYKRPDDGKFFDYKIKINGNKILWGNADGRWRDTKFDEKITFDIIGDKVNILQTFSDGSKIRKEFKLKD